MCIGVPMQVIEPDELGLTALCESRGERKRLEMLLTGPQPPGTWVLEFLGAARRVLDEDEAQKILAALQALEATLADPTAAVDHLFADLVDREPQLPEHLRVH
ncbi:MAG: HypC/HybG/HupF family hydrogenase formation chaperone [Betaproteobacteria bacterium]